VANTLSAWLSREMEALDPDQLRDLFAAAIPECGRCRPAPLT
jgi:hypothetical protein